MKKKSSCKFKQGQKVVYQVPGESPMTGVCIFGSNNYDRVSIQFDNGEWGYCYTGYVRRIHPAYRIEAEIKIPGVDSFVYTDRRYRYAEMGQALQAKESLKSARLFPEKWVVEWKIWHNYPE